MNLGNAFRKLGRPSEAEAAYRAAVQIAPGYVPARFNLGSLLTSNGDFESAEVELRAAIRLDPGLAEAFVVLADVLEATGRTQEAETELVRALTLRPDLGGAALNLGHLLLRMSRLEEAERWMLRASELDPVGCRDAISSYCFALNLRDDIEPRTIFEAHLRMGDRILAAAGKPFDFHANDPALDRKLRVGYVSSDFKQHPIGLFMRPILTHHDRSACEIHCYSSGEKVDDATQTLRQAAEHWHDVAGRSDSEVAALIRAHRIDILVDLSGHTDNTRLGLFALKAAPVQATWIGYLNTTGLRTMDYRICDRHAEPEGSADALHAERLHRMPDSQWCYEPWYEIEPIEVPHPDRPDAIVLGSFNQSQKIGDATLDLWSRVLRQVPQADLVMLDLSDERLRRTTLDKLIRRGIEAYRIRLLGRQDILSYFRAIGNVDIALDPYPYNGATTTLDTLWMGTPLVALRGDRGVARGSYSIMQSLGATELVAATPEEYVALNVRLANDGGWRRRLRQSLRRRLASSPLMDAPRFVANLEAAYRRMWRDWCMERNSDGPESDAA
jgi:predicted O-linked N-acetylglucosamine transferase (SPINDLY family)